MGVWCSGLDVQGFFGELIIGIALSPEMLILGWIVFLVLDCCWMGMSRFLSIMLFPGWLTHMVSHYLFAKIFGIRPYVTLGMGLREGVWAGLYTSSDIHRIGLWRVSLVAIAPMFVGIPMLVVLGFLLGIVLAVSRTLALVVAWMIISIATRGMLSVYDLEFIVRNFLVKNPDVALALVGGIVVYILGYLSYDVKTASLGVILYYVLIFLAVWLGRREEEIVVE